MKRIIALLMVFVLVLCSQACKKEDQQFTQEEVITEESTAATEYIEVTTPGVVHDPNAESNISNETEAEEDDNQEDPDVSEQEGSLKENSSESDQEENIADQFVKDPSQMTEFERYNAMSGAQQQEYMESFASIEAFFAWYNNAKAEHEALNPPVIIDGSSVDAEDLVRK